MKYILILALIIWLTLLALILYSCSSGYIVQDAQVTIRKGKISVKPVGPGQALPDTVMVVKMIRKK